MWLLSRESSDANECLVRNEVSRTDRAGFYGLVIVSEMCKLVCQCERTAFSIFLRPDRRKHLS